MTFRTAMFACGRARKWQPALSLLADAEQRGVSGADTCAAAMDACVAALRWEQALAISDARGSGHASDATRAVLVRACASGVLWQQGLSLLADMRREARGSPETRETKRPRRATLHRPRTVMADKHCGKAQASQRPHLKGEFGSELSFCDH